MDVKPVGDVRRVASEFRSDALSPAPSVPDAAQPGAVYCCGIGTSCTFIASATEV